MNRFLTRLFHGSPKRRPYEQQCLDWLRERLPSDGRSILAAQLAELDFITRIYQDKLTELQFADRSKLTLFPNQQKELHAVRLWIVGNSAEPIRCDIVFDSGRIVNLEFARAPKTALDGPLTLKSLELYTDLMSSEVAQTPEETPAATPILDALRSRLKITNVQPPASMAQTNALLGRLLTTAPEDFAALLRETNGFTAENWDFKGVAVRRQVDHEATYLYLAESMSFALALREEATTPHYILHDQVNEEFTELGASFVDAFLKAIAAESASEAE